MRLSSIVIALAVPTLVIGCGPSVPDLPDVVFVDDDGGVPEDARPDAPWAMEDAPVTPMDGVTTLDGTVTTADGETTDGEATDGGRVSTVENDLCAGAIPLVAGTPLTGTTVGALHDYGLGPNCSDSSGPDVVYVIDVPANKTVTVTATPMGTYDLAVALMNAECGGPSQTCLASENSNAGAIAETVSWVNTSATTVQIYAVVDGYFGESEGAFTIEAAFTDPLAGDVCDTAIPLLPGAPLTGTTVGADNDYTNSGTSGCSYGNNGPDVVYAVTIPPRQVATVTLSPSGFDSTLNFVDAFCGGSSHACLAGRDSTGTPEVLSYRNATDSDLLIYAIVDGYSASASGSFTISVAFQDVASGDVCETAPVIGEGVTTGSNIGANRDYNNGSGCGYAGGPDVAYAVDIPAGQTMVATYTGSFDSTLEVIGADCVGSTAPACLARTDTPEIISYRNSTSSVMRVYVIVASYFTSDPGDIFTLDIQFLPPAENEGCDVAPLIGEGTVTGTTVGASRDYGTGTGCTGTSGPDVAYAIDVPSGMTAMVTVAPQAGYNASINLVNASCGMSGSTRTCLAGRDSGGAGVADTASYRNASGATERIFAIVGASSSTQSGTFNLSVSFVPPAANDTCELAPVITEGTLSGTTFGAANDYSGGTGCGIGAGPDVAYTIDVPAGHTLSAAVTPESGYDTVVSVIGADCGAGTTSRTCLAYNDSGVGGGVDTVSWRNTAASTARVHIIVDSYSSSGAGAFSLVTRLIPPASNETCATAPLIGAGTSSGTTTGAAHDYGGGASPCGIDPGADVAYAIDIPARNLATVTVSPQSGFDASITLVNADCGGSPRTCLARSDTGSSGSADTVTYRNTTDATLRVYAIVDSFSSTQTGAFDITVAFTAPAANDTCADAPVVGPGSYMASTAGATNDYSSGTGCVGMAGADVVYPIDVPAGQRLTASVFGVGAFNPSLNLIAGPASNCSASTRSCLRGSDVATVDTVTWVNHGASTQRIYVIVDSASSTTTGMFTLSLSLGSPAAGDVCTSATRVGSGTTSGTTAGFVNDYGAGAMCVGTAGVDRVYVVSVGAGQTLTAAVTPTTAGFDPSISLEAACGIEPRVCLAGNDSGGVSATNTVSYSNTSGTAEDIFIVIDTALGSAPGGTFDLTVTLAAP